MITIAVFGQVKAGKSSLINCLLVRARGGRRAAFDAARAAGYRLEWPDRSEVLVLLDASGYSDAGATDQRRAKRGKRCDRPIWRCWCSMRLSRTTRVVAALDELAESFALAAAVRSRRHVAVLDEIDRLSPVLEWSPPYRWRAAAAQGTQRRKPARYARECSARAWWTWLPPPPSSGAGRMLRACGSISCPRSQTA